MNPAELRLGNFIYEGDEVISITSIGEDIADWPDWFKPIPLTEEWLKRFGFEGDIHLGYGFDVIELNYITTDEHFEYEYGIPKRNGKIVWVLIKVKFVHQLQNLYYALCGTELSLTKNDALGLTEGV